MKTEINYHRSGFNSELEHCIQEGENLYKKFNGLPIDRSQLHEYQRYIMLWAKEIQLFLKNRLTPSNNNPFLKDFKRIRLVDTATLSEALKGKKLDTTTVNYKYLLACNQKQIDVLTTLKSASKYMPVVKGFSDTTETTNQSTTSERKEIFISHSSKDYEYVKQFIAIIERIGVPSHKIFCSSFDGYGVVVGDNFMSVIQEKLTSDTLVIFMLSDHFFTSKISLLEMETTLRRDIPHIPVVIPPFDYKDLKGPMRTTNGMEINDKLKYNNLKDQIETFFKLTPINSSIWEQKRDDALKEIEKLLTTK